MARSGDADLAMGLFPHSFVDLEEIPLITPKLTLLVRRDVRFTFIQIGLKELSQQPMVLLQPLTTTRAVIDGAFGKTIARCTLNEMEASTCVEIKRYVASAIDISIIHDICLAQDHNLFRTVNLENIFSSS